MPAYESDCAQCDSFTAMQPMSAAHGDFSRYAALDDQPRTFRSGGESDCIGAPERCGIKRDAHKRLRWFAAVHVASRQRLAEQDHEIADGANKQAQLGVVTFHLLANSQAATQIAYASLLAKYGSQPYVVIRTVVRGWLTPEQLLLHFLILSIRHTIRGFGLHS